MQPCLAVLGGLFVLLCVFRGLRVRLARHRVEGYLRLHGHGGPRPARRCVCLVPGIRLNLSLSTDLRVENTTLRTSRLRAQC